jgi:hypothetical protein
MNLIVALSRFVYLIVGSCALYISLAPYFSRWHGSPSFVTLGYWVCATLLLIAATLPRKYSNALGLIGSAFATTLLTYGIARFEDNGQLGACQPKTFDRINGIVSKPVLFLFLFSSLASLVISALITVRLRNRTLE